MRNGQWQVINSFRPLLKVTMILETSMYDINGTVAINIPPAFVAYFGLKANQKPWKCKIEEIGKNEAKITFTKM